MKSQIFASCVAVGLTATICSAQSIVPAPLPGLFQNPLLENRQFPGARNLLKTEPIQMPVPQRGGICSIIPCQYEPAPTIWPMQVEIPGPKLFESGMGFWTKAPIARPKIQSSPPASLKRGLAYYASTNEFRECEAARVELLDYRKVGDSIESDPRLFIDGSVGPRPYIALLNTLMKSCGTNDGIQRLQQIISPAAWHTLQRAVGMIITKDSEVPFCTAFLVKRHIVTAAHCFAEVEPENASFVPIINRSDRLQFHRLQQPSKDAAIERLRSQDIEVFAFDPGQKATETLLNLDLGQVKRWRSLAILGVDPFWLARELLERTSRIGPTSLASLVPFFADASPACFDASEDVVVIRHMCMTDPSMSGAPVLAFDEDGQISVVGIQTDTLFGAENSEDSAMTTAFPNRGMPLNQLSSIFKGDSEP